MTATQRKKLLKVKSEIESMFMGDIKRSNELTMELDALMEKYKPIYLERECMLNTLRVYKGRGIINESEMPKIKRHNIQKELAEYRKTRKEN